MATIPNLPEGWQVKTLGQILTDQQLGKVLEYMRAGNWLSLRAYLNNYRGQLEEKGVVADYLWYWLQANRKQILGRAETKGDHSDGKTSGE